MSAMSRTSGSGLWTLIKILGIVFLLTACYTADLVQRDPSQLFIAILIWACLIAGLAVLFMVAGYWGGSGSVPNPNLPLSQSPQYAHLVPPGQFPGLYGMRQCRYCDGHLTPTSPICPRCGRMS